MRVTELADKIECHKDKGDRIYTVSALRSIVMATIKEVCEEMCLNDAEERLFKAVMRKIGDWEAVFSNPYDYRDAGCGVPGFTHYKDTVQFAKRHIEDILVALEGLEADLGIPLKKDINNILNWYAWFALESMVQFVIDYKEML